MCITSIILPTNHTSEFSLCQYPCYESLVIPLNLKSTFENLIITYVILFLSSIIGYDYQMDVISYACLHY